MKTKLFFLFSLSFLIQSCTFIEDNLGLDLRLGKDKYAPIDANANKRSPDTNPDLTDIALEKQKRAKENSDPYDGYEVNSASNGASIRQIDASMNRASDDVLLSGANNSATPTPTIVKASEKNSEKPKTKKKKSKKQNSKPKTQAQPSACVPVQEVPAKPAQMPAAKPVILTPAPVVKTETKSEEIKPVTPKVPVLAAPKIEIPTVAPVTPAPAAPKTEVPTVPVAPATAAAPEVEVPTVLSPKVAAPTAPAASVVPVQVGAKPAAPAVSEIPVPATPTSAEEVLINPFPPFNPEPLIDDKTTLENQALTMPPVPNVDGQNAELDEFKKSLKDKYKDEQKGNLDGIEEANLPPLDLK